MSWIALVACIVYIIGCYVFKGNFPFYKFELYAASANREKAAVPVFLVMDDKQEWIESNIWEYHHFIDLQHQQFLSHRMPTSVTWMVEEAAQWVKDHPGKEQTPKHKQVGFAFRVVEITQAFEIQEEIIIVEQGMACLKQK